jgi:type VI secretion system protein ImpD
MADGEIIAPDNIPADNDLLSAVLAATEAGGPSPAEDFQRWWLSARLPGGAVWTRARLRAAIDRDIAAIDRLLTRQVNGILHHPRFQKLEASWRGVAFLLQTNRDPLNIKVRVLNVTWDEVCRDLERAMEFDQSQMFQKIYGEEFDMPGGRPYGLLVGDYEVMHKRTARHRTDDVAGLRAMSGIAAVSFSPFVVGAAPELFEFDSFADFMLPANVTSTFRGRDYVRWQTLRNGDDSRFIGIALPHILTRLPYTDDATRRDPFRFVETIDDASAYVWGNAAFAFAAVAIRTYAEAGWFTDMRGARRAGPAGGRVDDLPAPWFATDRPHLIKRYNTDVSLTDAQEKELSDLGFIPLLNVRFIGASAFFSNQSIQVPKLYTGAGANANARLSAMLQYILSVSRFAHYIKILARERIGSFASAEDCEEFLRNWLRGYCNSSENASPETLARYPLRDANVQVREPPGGAGSYQCVVHLRPHSQADQVLSEFRLVTTLPAGAKAA